MAQGNWTHIHFIAHSAGAGVIQVATEVIKASLPNTVIHCTFLDPYDGIGLEFVPEYGYEADWADCYFSRDLLTGEATEQPLVHAYNVDVTTLDSKATPSPMPGYVSGGDVNNPCYKTESSHGWPVDFYSGSISGNPPSNYEGFGLLWSEEAGSLALAAFLYPPGNGRFGDSRSTKILGPQDPACGLLPNAALPHYVGPGTSFPPSSTLNSLTGTLQTFLNSFLAGSGSPVWIAVLPEYRP